MFIIQVFCSLCIVLYSCDTGGKYLVLASNDNDVMIVSGKPSEQFQVLGHTSKY